MIIVVRYNLGTGQHILMEPDINIADGSRHVVRFERIGALALLQIDAGMVRIANPSESGPNTQVNNDMQDAQDLNAVSSSSEPGVLIHAMSNRMSRCPDINTRLQDCQVGLVPEDIVRPMIVYKDSRTGRILETKKEQPGLGHIKNTKFITKEQLLVDSDVHKHHMNNRLISDNKEKEEISTEQFLDDITRSSESKLVMMQQLPGEEDVYKNQGRSDVVEQARRFEEIAESKLRQKVDRKKQVIQSGRGNKSDILELPNIRGENGGKMDLDLEPTSRQAHSSSTESRKLAEYESTDKRHIKESLFSAAGLVNIWLVIALTSSGVFMLFGLTCAVYRCRRFRDEGTYDVDESLAYRDPGGKCLKQKKETSTEEDTIDLRVLKKEGNARNLKDVQTDSHTFKVS
ncbi:unnamed protein product [Protopolystoma xenopodis]|uniref:Laminin G domain-containing protein n=1 Tax=Protopolystoma xenopodis TaxID=117903 RepID=A0A3S5B0Z6_9PLAT|nr:unnamed protein product [Protopolystoma xenopodis]